MIVERKLTVGPELTIRISPKVGLSSSFSAACSAFADVAGLGGVFVEGPEAVAWLTSAGDIAAFLFVGGVGCGEMVVVSADLQFEEPTRRRVVIAMNAIALRRSCPTARSL